MKDEYKISSFGKRIYELRFIGEEEVGEVHKGMVSTEYSKYKDEVENSLKKLDTITKEDLIKLIKTTALKFSEFIFSDKTKPKKDFVTTTGANVGNIINTELGLFINLSEGSLRNLKLKNQKRYECLYLGALCKINNITREDILKISK